MSEQEKYTFPGEQVDVEWDGRLCIHIGECGQSAGELFVGGRQPWCQPDLTSADAVVDIVERCPSGSLTYHRKDGGGAETPNPENTVTVSYNGPYFVRGELEITSAPSDMVGVTKRAALCRCGQSKIKPFCDNSHEKAGFRDYGAVGEKGEALSATGGVLSIQPLPDGPLLRNGNVTIRNGSGRIAWSGTQVALCRCGESKNRPFCDGSHKAVGFKG